MKKIRMEKDKRILNEKGFSLLEMLAVIAIMSIVAGIVIGVVGYISNGNAKRSAANLITRLDAVQVENLTKEGKTYLYIYEDGSDVYAKAIKADATYVDGFSSRSELDTYLATDSNATELSKQRVEVKAKGKLAGVSTEMILDSTNMIKICFQKSTGSFLCANDGDDSKDLFFDEIHFEGASSYTVKLVELTGKHFVD